MKALDFYSAEAVDARMRECSRLSEGCYGAPAISMTREAITARLLEASEMSSLCSELADAGAALVRPRRGS